jgi:sugar-specific transcriptional regulator TrmB
MSSQEAPDLLGNVIEVLDFSEYELTAYLSILDHGSITATGLATATDIPQPRVYDTLRSLDDRNVIELQETRPMRAIALEPSSAFQPAEEALSTLRAELQHRYTEPDRSDEAAYLVRSTPAIERRLDDIIESVEYELVLSVTPDQLNRIRVDLLTVQQRDVTVELVVAPAADAPDPTNFSYDQIATVARGREGGRTPVLAIADGSHALFTTKSALDEDDNDHYGVVFNRSGLGFLVYGFFETIIWSTADVVLLEEGAPPTLPAEYASLRRCIQELAHIDDEVSVHIEGCRVETNEPVSIMGSVVETNLSPDRSTAVLTVETESGKEVQIGGRFATYEDIEAHRITVSAAE